jgi:hypothetical protein
VILSLQSDELSLEEAFVTFTSQNVRALSAAAATAAIDKER